MKKIIVLFFVLCVHFGNAQNIEPRPNPPKAVNDFGNMLAPFQRDALEQKLDAYNDSTSSAIVIITVTNLNGNDIAEVALQYLRGWGIGTKDKNNGIVILVSKEDHNARIETGYGMEGAIPDVTAKEIIDDKLIPSFKQDDFYGGFNNTVDAIIQAAAGEYKANPSAHKGGPSFKTIFILVIFFIILLSFFRGGGGGGSYMSRRGSTGLGGALPWFLLGNMLGGGGRGGGGFGGGGFGGGGGGFGGFGGGGGGGGGASGGW
jgi:uncharacterized protein